MSLKTRTGTKPAGGKWRRASLSVLLTAWYTTASFVVVAIATGSLYFGLANNLRRISEQSLLDQLDVCRRAG